MFLRGVFENYAKPLGVSTLESVHDLFFEEDLPSNVKNNMFELVNQIDKGLRISNTVSLAKYSYVMTRNQDIGAFNEKVRHKEFAIDSFDEDSNSLPKGTVDEGSLSNELSLNPQTIMSWQTALSKNNIDALEFQDELQENIDVFNQTTRYLYESYGFDFRFLSKQALNGFKDSKNYLDMILAKENDEEFSEALNFLSKYQEFYDYINSNERGILTID